MKLFKILLNTFNRIFINKFKHSKEINKIKCTEFDENIEWENIV